LEVNVHDFFAHGVFAVTFPARHAPNAKAYWQHCGEIVSSRLAEETLDIVSRTCWENASRSLAKESSTGEPIEPIAPPPDRASTRLGGMEAATPWRGSTGGRRLGVVSSLDREKEAAASGNSMSMHRSIGGDGLQGGAWDKEESLTGSASQLTRRTSSDPCGALTTRIAALTGVDRADVFLFPTGMASIAASQRLLKLSSDWDEIPLRNIVFGFPYLDTLKLNSRPELGSGVVFFGKGDEEDLTALEALLQSGERIGGLFCEFPSNPLLRAPDLAKLRSLADQYGFPIVCDDTVVGFHNVDLLGGGGVDILVSSLTKQFSGSNNAMGGSLVLNPEAPLYDILHSRLARDYEPMLWRDDAATLLSGSSDYEARCRATNSSAMALDERFKEHPAVSSIYHPSLERPELYDEWRRREAAGGGYSGGYGALFSMVLKEGNNARAFYDGLDVAKGPGFGSNFTLVCPYTMIAHYNELEWCSEFGVDRSLIRVWTGLEHQDELAHKFEAALEGMR